MCRWGRKESKRAASRSRSQGNSAQEKQYSISPCSRLHRMTAPVSYTHLASPISYICNGFRNTFLYHTWFFETPYETLIFFAWLIVLAFLGSRLYKKLRRTLPDILA